LSEVIYLARKIMKDCLIFKLDFRKALDSISWVFLDYMMRMLGFTKKWKSWICACVFTCRLSVLVDGCLTHETQYYLHFMIKYIFVPFKHSNFSF